MADVAEVAKPMGIAVEEDALDLPVGNGEQERAERFLAPPENDRRLAVEVALLDAKPPLPMVFLASAAATRYGGDERRNARRALQGLREIGTARDLATFRAAVGDQRRVVGEELDEPA